MWIARLGRVWGVQMLRSAVSPRAHPLAPTRRPANDLRCQLHPAHPIGIRGRWHDSFMIPDVCNCNRSLHLPHPGSSSFNTLLCILYGHAIFYFSNPLRFLVCTLYTTSYFSGNICTSLSPSIYPSPDIFVSMFSLLSRIVFIFHTFLHLHLPSHHPFVSAFSVHLPPTRVHYPD